MGKLKDFLGEKKLVSRGMVLVFALIGAFAGACLMLMMALLGILS